MSAAARGMLVLMQAVQHGNCDLAKAARGMDIRTERHIFLAAAIGCDPFDQHLRTRHAESGRRSALVQRAHHKTEGIRRCQPVDKLRHLVLILDHHDSQAAEDARLDRLRRLLVEAPGNLGIALRANLESEGEMDQGMVLEATELEQRVRRKRQRVMRVFLASSFTFRISRW
jgi:hypothetical protein